MEMQAFLPYLLPLSLLLIPLSPYLGLFIRKLKGSNDQHNLPRGSKGWPMLGENVEFSMLGPQKFIQERMEKYSNDVFKTSLLGEKMAIFCGAQGNKFLFMNENKLVQSWIPKSMKKALVFPEFVDSSLKKVSALIRSFHYDFLKPEALKQYIPVMDALARKQMDSDWKPGSVVKVVPLSKKYTFELSCKLFLNVVDPENIKELFDTFNLMTNGLLSVPIDLPGTAYNRAIKGGGMVRKVLTRIIKQRRKELIENEGQDLLTKMLLMRDEDGEPFNEAVISNNIIGLLVASFETTSSAVTAVINYLAEFPHIYEQVFKEQMEIARSKGPNELLTWQDMEKMNYSRNVARESLRGI